MKNIFIFFLLFLTVCAKGSSLYKKTSSPDVLMSSIIADTDSSLIILGNAGYPSINTVGLILRINQSGDTLWSKKLDDSLGVHLNEMCLSYDSSSIYIVGKIFDTTQYGSAILLKIDHDGNILDQKKYRTNQYYWEFFAISFIGENKISIAATEIDTAGSYYSFGTILIGDTTGSFNKAAEFVQLGQYGPLVNGPSNSLFITKLDHDMQTDESHIIASRIDSSFSNSYWSNYYDIFSNNQIGDIGKRPLSLQDGSLIFSGGANTWHTCPQYNTIKVDSMGNTIWVNGGGPSFTLLPGHNLFFANAAPYCSIEELYFLDSTGNHFTNFDPDINISYSSLSSIGNQIYGITDIGYYLFDTLSCVAHTIGNSQDSTMLYPVHSAFQTYFSSFALPSENSHIVTSDGYIFYTDCFNTSIAKEPEISYEIFPNPSTEKFVLKTSSYFAKDVLFIISDLQGRVQQKISFNKMNDQEILFDASKLNNGIYFVEIIAGDCRQAVKLAISK